MMNSHDAETILDELEKALPASNVLLLNKVKKLRSHISELEYLIGDLAEGLEDDGLNERVEQILGPVDALDEE
jgi:hypothetical protein